MFEARFFTVICLLFLVLLAIQSDPISGIVRNISDLLEVGNSDIF